jgi:hypothetical protein
MLCRPLQRYLEVVHRQLEVLDAAGAAAAAAGSGSGSGDDQIGETLLAGDYEALYSTPMQAVKRDSAMTMGAVLASLVLAVVAIQLS